MNLEPTIDYEEWTPEELAFDEQKPTGISDTIIDTLANDIVVSYKVLRELVRVTPSLL